MQKDLPLLFVTYEELYQVGTPSSYPTDHLLSQSLACGVPHSSRIFYEAHFPKTGLPTILVFSDLAAPDSDTLSFLPLSKSASHCETRW